jgi:hypothetical protein
VFFTNSHPQGSVSNVREHDIGLISSLRDGGCSLDLSRREMLM